MGLVHPVFEEASRGRLDTEFMLESRTSPTDRAPDLCFFFISGLDWNFLVELSGRTFWSNFQLSTGKSEADFLPRGWPNTFDLFDRFLLVEEGLDSFQTREKQEPEDM